MPPRGRSFHGSAPYGGIHAMAPPPWEKPEERR